MWVIIDAPSEWTRSYVVENDSAGRLRLRDGLRLPVNDVDQFSDLAGLEGIVHLLPHGGEVIRRSTQHIDGRALNEINDAAGFLPEDSRRILARTARFFERLPDVRHVLACDTAFFSALPEEASLYAVPYRFSRQGIRRYGGDGLIHERAWRKVSGRWPGKVSRLISLHLGNHSSVTGIRDGRPVDTSVGFTPVEGLPSDTASGDVDPTLIFQLHSQGFSLEEILDLLSCQSGFTGYCGRPTGFLDLIRQSDDSTRELRRIFCYSLIKYVGASLSTLDGSDVFAISAEGGWEALELILEVCHSLHFLGIRTTAPAQGSGDEPVMLSSPDSTMPVIFFPLQRWKILYEQTLIHF